MKPNHIIISREFDIYDESNQEIGQINLEIELPREDEIEGGDYVCNYSIIGLGINHRNKANGVDSLQALLICIFKANAELEHYQTIKKLKIKWFGMSDLGLSTSLLKK